MKRLLAALALLIATITLFIPTAAAVGSSPMHTGSFITLPTTDIHNSTAVFHGKVVEAYSFSAHPASNGQSPSEFIFKYGIAPGVYTHQVNAVIGQVQWEGYRTWAYFSALVTGLSVCQNYYVQLQMSPEWRRFFPDVVFSFGPEIRFTTTGCMIRTLGSGGLSSGTGTSTTSSLPVSAPVQMASVVVQNATITTTKVSPGQDVDIAASVTNKGTANGDAKLTLYVNGEAVESKGVTVASGQTAPVHFNVSRNEPGTYDVYVNGVPAGSFTVDVFTNNDNLIYIIMALFVMGISGTVFFLVRKRTA